MQNVRAARLFILHFAFYILHFSLRVRSKPDPRTARCKEMQLAVVVGTLVATQKHPRFDGSKLMLVQPVAPDDTPRGPMLLAVDTVGAGVREKVLIVLTEKPRPTPCSGGARPSMPPSSASSIAWTAIPS